MTSEQHEQPGQVCTCGHPSVDHDDDNVCTWELGPEDNGTNCPCIDYRTRPAAPSEPPAKTQQDDEREAVERIASQYRDPDAARFAINDFRDWLAARPSADTETLLPVRAEIIRQVREAAWHDGYEACRRGDQPHNPYRAALDGIQ